MTAWFDVKGFGGQPKDEDAEGMLASVAVINELVDAEVEAGISSESVVVGGFSQGEHAGDGLGSLQISRLTLRLNGAQAV